MARKTPEGRFKSEFIKDLRDMFPDCLIHFMDSQQLQGVPDILFIWHQYYAFFECKESERAARQPNQEYYIQWFSDWSFAAFVYPENKEEVLHALQLSFRPGRQARVSKR